MQNFKKRSKYLTTRSLFLAHYLLCSIGLLGVVKHIANWVGATIFDPINIFISYTDWANLGPALTKPEELLQYGLSVPALLGYYAIALVFMGYFLDVVDSILQKFTVNKITLSIYFGASLVINLAILKVTGSFFPILFILWLLFLAWPALPLINIGVTNLAKMGDRWMTGLLATLVVCIGFTFYPYMAGGFPISNDYMDIPEQTILSTGIVDNAEFINKNNIGGLSRHDPRSHGDDQKLPKNAFFINLKKDSKLLIYINNSRKFHYDQLRGVLVIKGSMTEEERDTLIKDVADDGVRERINDFYYKQMEEANDRKVYSPEEIEFIQKNRREFRDQSLAGHYFHHQHTMLGTINEYILGKPRSETVFLYGWLSTVFIAEAMKIFGGINFESYQKVFYSIYPVYYFLLMMAAVFIFKKKNYALLVAIVTISSLYLVEFETIRFAPGFNPIRHFFDIFVLLCFYRYLFASRWNLLFLIAAFGFSIIGFLFNKEFGLALFLSLSATVLIRSVMERRRRWLEYLIMAAATIVVVAAFYLITTGKNPTLLYVLLGVAAPSMHWVKIFGLLLFFSAIYIILLGGRWRRDGWAYLTFLWFTYAQGLLIYYVWNPAPNHLWSLGSVWGVALVLLLRYATSNFEWIALHEKKVLLVSNLTLLVFLFVPSIGAYYLDQRDYQKIFDTHKVHSWNLSRAKFSSTMEPSVFVNAVELIDKYSNGNSIYILSKYDNILPFLSAKYSAMPYPEMALSLVTSKEMDKSVELIRHHQPKYLFVDTDMTRSHFGDVFDPADPVSVYAVPVYSASMGRALVLDNFAKVFEKISPLYESVEVGNLITVYRLRSAS